MFCITLIILLGILFIVLKTKVKGIEQIERYKKVTLKLDVFLSILPIIAIVFFSVLFATELQGRILERSSHAFILLFLWIISTSFYTELMKHYNNKQILITSIVGFIISVGLAITLTPLDRYCLLVYSHLNVFSFILGAYLMLIFYMNYLLNKVK